MRRRSKKPQMRVLEHHKQRKPSGTPSWLRKDIRHQKEMKRLRRRANNAI